MARELKCVGTDRRPDLSLFPDDRSYTVFPGFCDVHVHFREPGFSYKETVRTGSLAAAHGGYTAVCAMPNLDPVPDCPEHLATEQRAIERGAVIRVLPYGSITRGEEGRELSDMEALSPFVVAFSDDGKGVQDDGVMLRAMEKAAACGRIVAAHCEVASLSRGGVVHAGAASRRYGVPGIPSSSEWCEVERDVRLANESGCALHICHVSCRESVEIVRDAKKSGVDVTCETAPHYLVFTEDDVRDDGRFRMNPPLRSRLDRESLLEGLADGTVDMIATDHAPHTAQEKAKGLFGASGIVGLEAAFPALYTHLVKGGALSLESLVRLMARAPRERFAIPFDDGFSVWDMDARFTLDPSSFLSMGRSTPFEGQTLYGVNYLTSFGGKAVWKL